jgi:hypothetical protein
MSRLIDLSAYRYNNNHGARESESPPTLVVDWQQFHQFLLQRMTGDTAEDRLRYAKHYAHVLTSNGIPLDVLQLSPNKRIHVMKALSSLARFTGRSDTWQAIRQRHRLSWSTGTEKIDAFQRFFDDSKSLDLMLQWLREAMQILPADYANFFLFCTLTGMRASECVESVRLINSSTNKSMTSHATSYYNPERLVLEHFRYPEIFIRRTKAIYVSVVDDSIIAIARRIGNTPPKWG